MDFELVSLPICPFGQRVRIVLRHKHIAHNVTYIDPASPPGWFTDLSPLGKAPLLRVGDDAVLFESAAINEFIDETTPPPLMPAEPLVRAAHRAWIAFADEAQLDLGKLAMARDVDTHTATLQALQGHLGRIEEVLGGGPWFAGNDFSLVDASFAPIWMRLQLLEEAAPLGLLQGAPRTAAWSAALLALPAVAGSVDADFPERFGARVSASGGYGAARYAAGLRRDRAAS
jgi:glutathione S-transferase